MSWTWPSLVCLGPSWRIPAACRVSRRRWWQQPRGCRELVLEHWSRPSAVGASFARRRPMTSGGLHLSSWASSWGWWPLVGRRRRHRCMPASSGLRWPSGQPSTWTTSWPGPFVSTPCPTRGPRHQSWNLGSWSTSAWWWVRLGGPTRSCWPFLSWRQWAAFVLRTCSAPSSRPSTTPGWSSIAVRARAGSVVHGRHTPGACRMSPCKVRVSCASSMIFIAMKCPRQAFYFLRYASMQKTSGKSRNPRLLSPTGKCPVLGIWRSCAVPFSWRGQKRRQPKPRPSTAFAGASQRWQIRWNLVPLNSKLWATGPKSPKGGGRDPQLRKEQAVVPMGMHYAAAKVLRSAQVKQRCIDRLLALFNYKRPELALNADGLLCRDSWTWPEVAALHQLFPDKTSPVPLDLAELQKPDVEVADLPVQADRSVSPSSASATESSSSASDESAEGADLEGVLPDPTAPDEVTWLRQGRKLHLVRELTEEGRQVPWCRDTAFVQDPVARGVGFTMVNKDDMCKRCLARIPRADHSNWLYWETRAAYKTRCGWCGVPHVVRITVCPGRGPVIPRGDHSTVFQGFVLCWSFFSCLFWGMSWGARPWLSRTMSLTGVWQFWAHRPPGRFRHG